MAKAVWNGVVIAESSDTVIVEGNHYFPLAAVNPAVLRPNEHHSVCHWKGTASYYDIEVEGQLNRNAAWYYPEPSEAAQHVKGRVAFWKGVQVSG